MSASKRMLVWINHAREHLDAALGAGSTPDSTHRACVDAQTSLCIALLACRVDMDADCEHLGRCVRNALNELQRYDLDRFHVNGARLCIAPKLTNESPGVA